MVQFMSSENNNVWQLPEPEVRPLPLEDNLMYSNETYEDERLPKRWKPSAFETSTQQWRLNNNENMGPQYHYHPLNEPSPLGLRLRKSPSLLELAQKRLNQCNADKGNLVIENLEARTTSDFGARTKSRASGSVDKLKASHFPALLLRIGQWEYVSKHEGDLVAKCYFSKHKIVWEVLGGGLKKKFEINWADIVALKANFEAEGVGTLTISLAKQPLFFKEVNPQPRKHTQWRATSDFTNGEASTNKQHFLQCAPGVLDKHYEKMIQCDTRLYFLSQNQAINLDFPYLPPKMSDMDHIAHLTSSKTVGSSSFGLIHQDMSKEAYSSSSGMSMDLEGQKDMQQLKEWENISQMLLSDSHLAADSEDKFLMSRVNSLCSLLQNNPNVQQDGNVLFTPEPNLIPHQDRNDIYTLDPNLVPQQYTNVLSTHEPNHIPQQYRNDHSTLDPNITPLQDRNDGSTLDPSLILHQYGNDGSTLDANLNPENRTQVDRSISLSTNLPQQDVNDGSTPESSQLPESASGSNVESGISRKDSYSDLVHQLPRIASLPRFLFEISESGEILR